MWINKKYKTEFRGTYAWTGTERVFQLVSGKKTLSFESHQQAKKQGWTKV